MVIQTNFDTNNTTVFFQCDCVNETLVINYDHNIQLADVAIYETYMSFKNKLSLWQRLRYIIKVLRGYPYSDQITLNSQQLKELKMFLGSLDL